jgi:guanylate kinase
MPGVTPSISYTTRAPRGAEVDGRDYHFVIESVFDGMIEADEFIEWANVHGARYGTSARASEAQLARGLDVLLDIDVQGGAKIRSRLADAVLIFLLPPSMEELQRRLQTRATDSAEVIERRLSKARIELASATVYDYLVLNDDFEKAAGELRAIVTTARLRADRHDQLLSTLLGR